MGMIRPVKVEVEAEDVGRQLAHMSDWEQSAIINALGMELYVACGGNAGTVNYQLAHVSAKLTPQGREFIKDLAGLVTLREKEGDYDK